MPCGLSTVGDLSGKISKVGSLNGTITLPSVTEGPTIDAEEYQGDYDVIPKAFEIQTLPTKGKLMVNDVVVAAVPYYSTSNTANGTTVYIAKEGNRSAY